MRNFNNSCSVVWTVPQVFVVVSFNFKNFDHKPIKCSHACVISLRSLVFMAGLRVSCSVSTQYCSRQCYDTLDLIIVTDESKSFKCSGRIVDVKGDGTAEMAQVHVTDGAGDGLMRKYPFVDYTHEKQVIRHVLFHFMTNDHGRHHTPSHLVHVPPNLMRQETCLSPPTFQLNDDSFFYLDFCSFCPRFRFGF